MHVLVRIPPQLNSTEGSTHGHPPCCWSCDLRPVLPRHEKDGGAGHAARNRSHQHQRQDGSQHHGGPDEGLPHDRRSANAVQRFQHRSTHADHR